MAVRFSRHAGGYRPIRRALARLARAAKPPKWVSHAFYGATRHAITVGFISLMIVGVSSKVVPTLNGVDVKTLAAMGSAGPD
jgi:hypothetical protein